MYFNNTRIKCISIHQTDVEDDQRLVHNATAAFLRAPMAIAQDKRSATAVELMMRYATSEDLNQISSAFNDK